MHRKTTHQERPILFIGTALIVVFWDYLTFGWITVIVSAVVVLSWIVNVIEDRREYTDE